MNIKAKQITTRFDKIPVGDVFETDSRMLYLRIPLVLTAAGQVNAVGLRNGYVTEVKNDTKVVHYPDAVVNLGNEEKV